MSDSILSRLRSVTMPVYAKDERGDFHPMTNAITWVKRDDVREALRSDEAVDVVARELDRHHKIADDECRCGRWSRDDEDWAWHKARAVLAAAAGGDSGGTLVWACAKCGESPEQHAGPASDCLYMPILRRAGGDDE